MPVSPTGHVNPAVATPAPSVVDSNERRKRPDSASPDEADAEAVENASHPPAHQVDREI